MPKIKTINQGDLLTFMANDNKYKVLLCTSVYKEKSPYYFNFAALNYDDIEKPTLERILNCDFYGIGNRLDYFKYSEQELKKMWVIHAEIKPYSLGSYRFMIWRKDFNKFRENIEIMGNLKILENLDKNGNGAINSSDLEFLKTFSNEKLNETLRYKGQKLYKIKAILRDE